MKNKIVLIFIAFIIALPSFAEEPDIAASQDINQTSYEDVMLDENTLTETSTEQDQETVNIKKEDVPDQSPYKQPANKKKIIKKFMLAMLGVVLSSGLIYLILSIYNNIRLHFSNKSVVLQNETPLDTPSTTEEAVKAFIDKTRWDNLN